MQDYNPYCVQCTLTLLGVAERKVTLACRSMVKAVKEASVYCGSGYFCNDIKTSLPYVETVIKCRGCYDISINENHLVVEVCGAPCMATHTTYSRCGTGCVMPCKVFVLWAGFTRF
jgi:hypothetical protein